MFIIKWFYKTTIYIFIDKNNLFIYLFIYLFITESPNIRYQYNEYITNLLNDVEITVTYYMSGNFRTNCLCHMNAVIADSAYHVMM